MQVEVRDLVELEVSLDFTQALNVELEGSSSLIAKALVCPFKSEVVAVLRAYDEDWTTKFAIKVTKRSIPNLEEQRALLGENKESEIEIAKGRWRDFPLSCATHGMYLDRIKAIGTPFLDVQFPPNEAALGGDLTDRIVHWRRPKHFS